MKLQKQEQSVLQTS